MDLEGHARELYKKGLQENKILSELLTHTSSQAAAEAILTEIKNSENITDEFIQDICEFKSSGYSAGHTGLGCRGEGDFFIHRKLSELIENRDSIIDPRDQDDGGVVQVGSDFIIVSVDGMHSRLSHFPFIAGFHAARAAIRDTLVMGSEPKALLSDIHLANDGDVAKIFDYTAGIAVVSELTNTPLISGSTLRIGGDLVLGDRLTGCVGCVGFGQRLTPRRAVQPGDVLVMTEGHGGGTIATTALYNGFSEIVRETLNLRNITLAQKLLKTKLIDNLHSITDITNGGIRGDAFEIAKTASVRITLFEDEFRKLVNPSVLKMLTELDIDPLGVSIDSLLIIAPEKYVGELMDFIHDNGIAAAVVGRVEPKMETLDMKDDSVRSSQNYGVKLIKKQTKLTQPKNSKNITFNHSSQDTKFDTDRIEDDLILELKPKYREEPYTPIKKVVDTVPQDQDLIQTAIDHAKNNSLNKKAMVKDWMTEKGKV